MSRSKGKIPRITFRASEKLNLTDDNWQEVEAAYGHAVSLEARAQITLVSDDQFLRLSRVQTGFMDDAIRRVTRLRKSAQSFIAAVNERDVGDVTREYVDDELALGNALLNGDNTIRKYVREISAELARFVKTSEWTLQKLEQVSGHDYWPDGGHWEGWIRQLTQILDAHNLPTGARKDTDKRASDKASPFVELVHTLQKFIPSELSRAQHSKGALAVAINKARRESKPPVARRKARAKQSGRNTVHAD